MPFWDHLSLVCKETIFRRCTNFSDFSATFEKHFLMIIPRKLDDRVILENDGMFPSNLPIWSNKNRFLNHSLIFFVNCNQKTFSKKWKKITICIFMKMPPWLLHSGYFKSVGSKLAKESANNRIANFFRIYRHTAKKTRYGHKWDWNEMRQILTHTLLLQLIKFW